MSQFIDTNINLKLPYINSELSKHDKMTINNKGEYKNNMDDILNKKRTVNIGTATSQSNQSCKHAS